MELIYYCRIFCNKPTAFFAKLNQRNKRRSLLSFFSFQAKRRTKKVMTINYYCLLCNNTLKKSLHSYTSKKEKYDKLSCLFPLFKSKEEEGKMLSFSSSQTERRRKKQWRLLSSFSSFK
jgi:hypothetical protein